MELVYLWVEDYKNIHKQGFNFSPRFECKYDGETLTICDKKEKECKDNNYIENFFSDNINVTAIVGKNGSGKSSIFESLLSKKKVFIVVFDNELKVYKKSTISVDSNYSTEPLNNFFKNILYYSIGNKYISQVNIQLSYIDIRRTNELITKNYFRLHEYEFDIFNFIPEYIHFRFLTDFKLIESDESTDDTILSIKSNLSILRTADSGSIKDALNALRDFDDAYINYLLYQFEDISNLFEQIDLTESLHPKDGYLNFDVNEIQEILKECDIDFISKENFNKLKNNEYDKIPINELNSIFDEEYIELLFIKMRDFLEFDFYSINDANFNSLSNGEKTLYLFFINLIEYQEEDFLFILDEPDNTLHPNWQKKLLDELIRLLNKLEKKAHIIFTTHSPFLLSDIPKQNIIFLDTDDEGKCKVVDGLNEKKETFGANIHTLLSDSFFMEGGLMGEFAKGKIDKAIKLLNQKHLDEKDLKYCEQIISIIGEPIVKNQLERMLHNKKVDYLAKDTREEIELLKYRIDLLSKRL